MLSSTLRRALWRPIYSERLSKAQWTSGLRTHGGLLALAVFFDLTIVAMLSRSTQIDHQVARHFAWINIPTLSACALASIAMARMPRFHHTRWLAVLIAATTTTTMVWIQATGSLSSYFLITGAVIIACYRMYFGYSAGAIAASLMALLHISCFTLESLGFLRPEALFLSPASGIYELAEYRLIVLSSLLLVYLLTFVATNSVMNKLHASDEALAAARKQVADLGGQANRGRLSGTMLDGEYAVGERLGVGGFGEVYTALRVADEHEVAIKVLHPHLVCDTDFGERFRREAELIKRIPAHHTAPVEAMGIDVSAQIHYFVMELLRGEDLAAHMKRRGPLPMDELAVLATDIAAALDAAHAAQIVHRDLKPQNIFLNQRGPGQHQLRLLDFGMSKAIDSMEYSLTRSNAMIGTIGYMSPEQALGQLTEIGPASDVFSFAAILYRAATGHPAFQKSDTLAAIHDIVSHHPPPPSLWRAELGAQVDAVLTIGLAKRIDERYQSGGALARDFVAACSGQLGEPVLQRAQRLGVQVESTQTGL